MINETSSKL
jgi:hypothetical protein